MCAPTAREDTLSPLVQEELEKRRGILEGRGRFERGGEGGDWEEGAGHKAQIINKVLTREVLFLLIKPFHVPGLAKRPCSAMNRRVWAASKIGCLFPPQC